LERGCATKVPEHVKKRFAAAAAMLEEEQADQGRPAGAQADGDDEGGEQWVAGDDATARARGWDADECTSVDAGRAGGERDRDEELKQGESL